MHGRAGKSHTVKSIQHQHLLCPPLHNVLLVFPSLPAALHSSFFSDFYLVQLAFISHPELLQSFWENPPRLSGLPENKGLKLPWSAELLVLWKYQLRQTSLCMFFFQHTMTLSMCLSPRGNTKCIRIIQLRWLIEHMRIHSGTCPVCLCCSDQGLNEGKSICQCSPFSSPPEKKILSWCGPMKCPAVLRNSGAKRCRWSQLGGRKIA